MAGERSSSAHQRGPSKRWAGALGGLALLAALGIFATGSLEGPGASRARASEAARPAVNPRARVRAASLLEVKAARRASRTWQMVALVRGRPAAWVASREGVSLMRFDQRLVHLDLHAGSIDGGVRGWVYGDRVSAREVHRLLAAFNGGFKLTYANVGFMSGGRAAVALKPGLASVVTYAGGSSDIGAWRRGLPAPRKAVFSVLQNQFLLVENGRPATTLADCVLRCWGGTIGLVSHATRSGLGITSDGQLVWAGGGRLTPADLARALIHAGAVRAIELDINPFWVAGYLYEHHRHGPVAVAVLPGQHGIPGGLLAPYTRDFFTVVAN